MTPKNLFLELQKIMKLLVWTGTGNKIFGKNVYIIPENSSSLMQLSQLLSPACFIMETGQKCHFEHNNIVAQNFSIILFVENIQSQYGEGAIVGSCRIVGKSQGAGILDIEKEVLTEIFQETVLNASKVVLEGKNRTKVGIVKGAFSALFRILTFSARCELYG